MTDSEQFLLGQLSRQVETLSETVKDLDKKVDEISITLAEARGGWRFMLLISGASATIGGLIVKLLPWFTTMGPR